MRNDQTYRELFETHHTDEGMDERVKEMRHRIEDDWKVDVGWLHGKTVLDVGCGSGKYSLALAYWAGKVVSMDLHDAAAHRVPNFEKGDILDIKYPGETFDFVFCSGVAHHTSDPRKAFEECARVLKSGGRMYYAVYKWRLGLIAICMFRWIRYIVPLRWVRGIGFDVDNLYADHVHQHSRDELEGLFVVYGFRVVTYNEGKGMHRYYLEKC